MQLGDPAQRPPPRLAARPRRHARVVHTIVGTYLRTMRADGARVVRVQRGEQVRLQLAAQRGQHGGLLRALAARPRALRRLARRRAAAAASASAAAAGTAAATTRFCDRNILFTIFTSQ